MNPKIFLELSHYLCVLISVAIGIEGWSVFYNLGWPKVTKVGLRYILSNEDIKKKNSIHEKNSILVDFYQVCDYALLSILEENGWEISSLKADVGSHCPIIPSFRSRDKWLWLCQEYARLTQVLTPRL